MTNRPFHLPEPSDDDINHLNSLLDAMASGKHAPKADPASDADALAATARLVSGDSAAKSEEYPSEETLDSIWRTVMNAQSTAALSPTGPVTGASTGGASGIWRMPPQAPTSRLNSFLSFAAVAAVIIGLIGGAWMLRGSGTPNPPEQSRLAVPPLEESTPEAATSEWLTYIQPEECDIPTWRTYLPDVGLFESSAELPERQYLPLATPHVEDAQAVARAGRIHDACSRTGSEGSRETNRFQTQKDGSQWSQQDRENRITVARAISDQFPIQDPAAFGVPTTEPSDDYDSRNVGAFVSFIYLPEQAVELADGRIAIPWSNIFWEDDPQLSYAGDRGVWPEWPYFSGLLTVYSEESGTWKLDELLPFCVGDCDNFWSNLDQQTSASTTPNASPESSPIAETDWLSEFQQEECSVEPMSREEYAEIMRNAPDISGRSYTIASNADAETAQDVANVLRMHAACNEFGMFEKNRTLQSPAYLYYRSATVENRDSVEERANLRLENGELFSEQLKDLDPAELIVMTDSGPAADIRAGMEDAQARGVVSSPLPLRDNVYNPDHAVMLDDGRVAVPSTTVYWQGDPGLTSEYTDPSRAFTWITIVDEVDGQWLIDELFHSCIGDCDTYWAEWGGPIPDASGATPVATPIATPED